MVVKQLILTLPRAERGFHLITHEVKQAIGDLPETGMLHLFIQHTSAGLTLNENTDPAVLHDFATSFDRMVPEDERLYTHTDEGSDDMPAHIKTSMVGSSLTIPIGNGNLLLGTWQGIYLCEFRNRGGARRVVLTVQT